MRNGTGLLSLSICLKMIARVITLPLLLIATLFAEIGNRICRLFVKELSINEQYAKLQKKVDPNLFLESQKHMDRNRYCDILSNEPTRFKIEGDPSLKTIQTYAHET